MFHGSQSSHRKKEQDVCLECGGSGTKTMAFASTRRFGPDWEVIETWGGVEFWQIERDMFGVRRFLPFCCFWIIRNCFFQMDIWEWNGKISFVMCIRLSCALTELVWWFHCNLNSDKRHGMGCGWFSNFSLPWLQLLDVFRWYASMFQLNLTTLA